MSKEYFVYIATNEYNSVLYVGVTNNLERRIYEHQNKLVKGFTEKYNINKLIFFENFSDVNDAIAAEKKIKGWTRKKKFDLILSQNPKLEDLLRN
jgi:putative endonuclease